jgi:hypothetical protein
MAEVSTSIWDSRILRRLDLFGALVALLVLGRLVFEEDLGWVTAATAGVLVLLLTAVKWPYGAFVVLFAMSAASGFQIDLLGWNAHPEHFAVGIIAVVFVILALSHKVHVTFDALDYWIFAYVAVTVFSSAFASPDPASTLRWSLQGFLAILPYFFIRALVHDGSALKNSFYILLAVGFAESCYGIAAYFSYQLFDTTFGMSIGQYGAVAVPNGTTVEPNLFGAYAAASAVGFLALFNSLKRGRGLALTGFLVASLAVFLSFSRAALLALILVAGWLLLRAKPSGNRGRIKKLVFVVGLSLLAVALGTTAAGGILHERFTELISSGLADDTTLLRYATILEALQDIPGHYLVGLGANSLQLTSNLGRQITGQDRATWVGILPIRVLHDSGILGLIMVAGFFVSLWLRVRSGLRNKTEYSPILLGLWAGALVYGITFQATDGTILAFSWVHFGLLASAATLATS